MLSVFKKHSIFFISLVVLSTGAFCQQGRKDKHVWSTGVFYDQDYTLEMFGLDKLNEDRNYTMGLGLFFGDSALKRTCLFKPLFFLNHALRKQQALNDPNNINPNNKTSFLIGNGSFTPDSLPAYYIIRNDRPYGSITYLQLKTDFTDYNNLKRWSSYLNIGVLGSNISKAVQTAIHKSMNEGDTKAPRTPRGWSNQISNGGELTLLYSGEIESLISRGIYNKEYRGKQRTRVFNLELKHGLDYGLGYYTYAGYYFQFRTGWIDPRNWTYEVNPLSGNNKAVNPYLAKSPKGEYYVFGSLRPTFILYNALLNGQFKESVHTVSFADMRHTVLEFDFGLALAPVICNSSRFQFNIKFSGRSPEFNLPGRQARWHYWGGLDFVYLHF